MLLYSGKKKTFFFSFDSVNRVRNLSVVRRQSPGGVIYTRGEEKKLIPPPTLYIVFSRSRLFLYILKL